MSSKKSFFMFPNIIDTHKDLIQLVEHARTQECVAMDTEFVWEQTYYPQLGIIQVGFADGRCYCIDTVVGMDMSPLVSLIQDPGVVKIFHDAHQDLVILHRATGAYPENIFDIQRAAGFIGESCTISLQNLLASLVGVTLSKTETRTNWLARPLSPEQVEYALNDVRYMPAARKVILERAESKGCASWALEEMKEFEDRDLYREKGNNTLLLRIKGSKILRSRELAVLRELAAWREEEACQQDRPREHVVPDRALLSIARVKPRKMFDLRRSPKLTKGIIIRYGRKIIDAVKKGLALPESDRPRQYEHPEYGTAISTKVDRALAYIKNQCAGRGIDPLLVGSRSEVADFVRSVNKPEVVHHRLLCTWRRAFVGENLLKIVQRTAMNDGANFF